MRGAAPGQEGRTFLPLASRATRPTCRLVPLPDCSVRWHMASVGTEVDIHNLHFHGNTFLK